MVFWILEERGHGRFRHLLPKQVNAKKAQDLESNGIDVFDSKKDAQNRADESR